MVGKTFCQRHSSISLSIHYLYLRLLIQGDRGVVDIMPALSRWKVGEHLGEVASPLQDKYPIIYWNIDLPLKKKIPQDMLKCFSKVRLDVGTWCIDLR